MHAEKNNQRTALTENKNTQKNRNRHKGKSSEKKKVLQIFISLAAF